MLLHLYKTLELVYLLYIMQENTQSQSKRLEQIDSFFQISRTYCNQQSYALLVFYKKLKEIIFRESSVSGSRLSSICKCKHCFSTAFKLVEFVSSPRLALIVMVSQIRDGSTRFVAFFDVSLVAFVDVIMERIFKSNSVVLLSALDSDSECSDDRFVCSPRIRDKSSSIEKSWSNNISFEVFLNSSLLELPSNNFNIGVSIISNFQQMKAIVVPIVTLGHKPVVEVVVNIVVVAKVVGRVYPRGFIHKQKLYVDQKQKGFVCYWHWKMNSFQILGFMVIRAV